MNKRNIFLWAFYDFANSIVVITFLLYFSQWLTIDQGVSDFWYNMLYTGGTVMLFFTAPVLASLSDRNQKEWKYLRTITVFSFLFFFLSSIAALNGHSLMAALGFLLANYFYQFSFVFYNRLLEAIAPPDQTGFISGLGQTANWLGAVTGILLMLPLAHAGRAHPLLPATVLGFLLTIPVLLFFRYPKAPLPLEKISLKAEYKSQWRHFKSLIGVSGMGVFLLGYFFFNDAIITMSSNFPIYLEQVFQTPDSTKSLFAAAILSLSAVGAFISGWVSDRIGLRKTLFIILGTWIVVFPLLSFLTNFTLFGIVCVMVGLLYGAIWTVTRAVIIVLCPKDKLNYGMSFYTLFERFSTLVGPLAWGIATSFTSLGTDRYRIAMFSMGIFVAIGFVIVRKIPELNRAV